MSADNFNYLRRVGQKWHVYLNLNASTDLEPQLAETTPAASFDDGKAALAWADRQGYVEYGTQVEAPPIDVSAAEWIHNLELQNNLDGMGFPALADEVRRWLNHEPTRGGYIDYREFVDMLGVRYEHAVKILRAAKERLP